MTTLPLLEVRLPAGRASGMDLMLANGDQRRNAHFLPAGYGGFRIIGAGRSLTHLMVDDDAYHDAPLMVAPFAGVVQVESLSIHGGGRSAIHFGSPSSGRHRGFTLRCRDVDFVADQPTAARPGRTRWGYRSYQADVDLEECDFYWGEAAEHCGYADHFNSARGLDWRKVKVHSSGAEGCKVRCPPSDGLWTPGVRIRLLECEIRDCFQPHSWRGGACFVGQGTGAKLIEFDRCTMWGKAGSAYMRTIMIDNGGGAFYSASDGVPGGKFANGHVVIRRTGLFGGPGPEWFGPVMRVGPDGSSHMTAQSITIEDCGVYGAKALAQLSGAPTGKIRATGCNTPAIRDWCASRGMPVEVEAMLPGNPLVPFSRGMVA